MVFTEVHIVAHRGLDMALYFMVLLVSASGATTQFCRTDSYDTAILMAEQTRGAFGPVRDRVHEVSTPAALQQLARIW